MVYTEPIKETQCRQRIMSVMQEGFYYVYRITGSAGCAVELLVRVGPSALAVALLLSLLLGQVKSSD